MISDSMLHFFAVYVLATGFNTLYCIQYDIRVDMEIVKYYHEYTWVMALFVWELVCIRFMFNMETAKVFTSLQGRRYPERSNHLWSNGREPLGRRRSRS